MWVVKAFRGDGRSSWDFPVNFFPRRCYYKKDAETYAKEAKTKGGVGISVEKEKKKR